MKYSRFFGTLIKWVVLLCALVYILYRLRLMYQNGLLEYSKVSFHHAVEYLIPLMLVLLVINWTLEALKWKVLIKHIETISLFASLKAILAGITMGIFTPNRVGEFAGRMLVLPQDKRLPSVTATFMGSLAQVLITLMAGVFAVFHLWNNYASNITLTLNKNYFFLSLLVVFVLGLFVYLLFPKISSLIVKEGNGKWLKSVKFAKKYQQHDLWQVFLYSGVRYLIYVLQYFVMLRIFGLPIGLQEGLVHVFLIYFILTFLPTFALAEIGVRTSVALFVFAAYPSFSYEILMASVLLWVFNLAIPALFGARFLYKFKV